MRVLIALLLSVPLLAQQSAPAQPAKTTEAPKAGEKKAEASQPDQQQTTSPAPAPTPSVEQWLTSGSLEFGYRVVSDVGGSFNSYRSVVDLGEGPKLFGWDFTLQDPKKRLFDRLESTGTNWGGEPYSTARLNARKAGIYDFSFDYRNIAYFNYLPSYANPLLDSGTFINQNSYDLRHRMSDFQLDLRPGKRIIPYVAYSRDSGFGNGISNFVTDGNEYPLGNQMYDKTDNYRGGVRLEFNRWHVTLEQGGTTFKDDEQLYSSSNNLGNRTTPLLGQQLYLQDLNQAYGVRGDSVYTKALFTSNPVSWADLYGQFLYSQPETNLNYSQANTGQFVVLSSLLFYTGQQDVVTTQAKQPHTSGNAGFVLRPFRRVRIIESWMTDRLHNATMGLLNEQLLLSMPVSDTTTPLGDRLDLNYNQQQVDVLVDATHQLTLRGGYRYVWGNALVRAPQLSVQGGLDSADLRRHVGLAGASFRAHEKLSFNVDFEGASSDKTYFRTSLHNYQLARARARYQVLGSLALSANFSILNNQNPSPGISYDYLSRTNSVSAYWTPNGGKRVTVIGEYMRSTIRSDINYLVPQDLSTARSFYRDNAHTGSAMVDLALPGYIGMTPRVAFGGSFVVSSGSRPARYYQPLARLSIPLHKHVYWNSEWRWYGFGEQFYLYEGFRAHLFMTGLRLTK